MIKNKNKQTKKPRRKTTTLWGGSDAQSCPILIKIMFQRKEVQDTQRNNKKAQQFLETVPKEVQMFDLTEKNFKLTIIN